jgi:hypothetical protein
MVAALRPQGFFHFHFLALLGQPLRCADTPSQALSAEPNRN